MNPKSLDYNTYCQIKDDLPLPIFNAEVDKETLKRLYDSKLFYLEHLRTTCFKAMNKNTSSNFTVEDYSFILYSIENTKKYLNDLVREVVVHKLSPPNP